MDQEFRSSILDALPRGWVIDSELAAYLNGLGKNRSWMYFLNTDYGLIPKGKVLPGVAIIDKELGWKNARGKRVAYPKDIEQYLEKIIKLNNEGNTYAEIKKMPEIQRERTMLQKLIDHIFYDPRIMDTDTDVMFRVAIKFLKEYCSTSANRDELISHEKWSVIREGLAKNFFYSLRNKIKANASPKALKEERDRLGRELYNRTQLMKVIIRQGLQLVKDGKVSKEEWLKAEKAAKV